MYNMPYPYQYASYADPSAQIYPGTYDPYSKLLLICRVLQDENVNCFLISLLPTIPTTGVSYL